MTNFKKHHKTTVAIIVTVIVAIICTLAYLFLTLIDFHFYFGWKDVKLSNTISIKVPNDWNVSKENGLIYFSKDTSNDKDKIILFQSKAEDMYDFGEPLNNDAKAEKNIVSHNFKSMIKVNSKVNSLSTVQGDAVISADNVTYKADYVSFNNNDEEITFYSWNDNLDTDTLEKIADSVSYN